MKLRSGIARVIDVRHASNRFAVAAPVVAGSIHFAAAAFTGSDFAASFRASFFGGGATFLGWAIGRELDPDDPFAANVAAIAAFAFAFVGDPYLAAGGVALIGARILARTTGFPPQPVDLLVLCLAAGYVGTRPGGILAVSVLALAVIVDRWLPGGVPAVNLFAGLAIAVLGTASAVLAGSWPGWSGPTAAGWGIVVAGLGAAGLSFSIPEPASEGDYSKKRLHHRRMQAARAGTVGGALLHLLLGAAGVTGMGPVWAAFIGAATTSLRRRTL